MQTPFDHLIQQGYTYSSQQQHSMTSAIASQLAAQENQRLQSQLSRMHNKMFAWAATAENLGRKWTYGR